MSKKTFPTHVSRLLKSQGKVLIPLSLVCLFSSQAAVADTVIFQKRSTSFSMDGGPGAENRRQVKLWNRNDGNKNQQWDEISVGGRFYQYKKKNTNHCLDGGSGAKSGQRVILYRCNSSNKNQHWEKKSVSRGNTRLKKRGFSFSIDGGNGAKRRQGLTLQKSQDSNINQHWFMRTVGGSSSTPPRSGSCDKPSDVLNLTNWKITIPFTSATGGSSGNTKKAAEVKQPAFKNYERSPIFTNSGCNYVQFRAAAGGATTSGSGFPRSELREMKNNGRDRADWRSDRGTHEMEVDLRVTKLPSKKPHVVVAQIHDGDDDVITFRLEGKKFVMEIDGKDGPTLDSNYSLGKRVKVRWVVKNGVTKSYFNGRQVHTLNKKYSGAYFKTGAYTQSACGGNKKVSGESCSAYGEVEIFSIKVKHN